MKVIVIGAGGHGREVAQVLRHQFSAGQVGEVAGFIDEDRRIHGEMRDGLPVLGDWDWFRGVDRSDIRVVVGIGTPVACRRVVNRATLLGLRFTRAISPLAWISPFAELGEGVTIFPHVVVSTQVSIGDHVNLNVAAVVSHDATVGKYTVVSPGVHLAGGVKVGEECFFGIGANVIPLCSIGDKAIVGAGAVVIRDVEPGTTVVGVPAHSIASSPLSNTCAS